MTAAEHARARADQLGGVDDVLSKPFDMDHLLRVVARFFIDPPPLIQHSE
ncbi:MAG TPA: hypothetical protein VFU28_12195 [Vicinamibacterales bacterium]|nr:hypothetical protein [Vicinamibacterales bacterium]